ncbi:glyoxalase [Iamia sp. SCSIO 61187]|uniref:VOC family protein n=1 Tax=Iamia sp. SCSIO 61187 TaxID=2722752 RepID=UPI001C634B19|nr:VOC family protein [Iamia sp. SCSIO 61187]QYG94127.1 glyoxalase [Iamia sp. SCSIO 61187]
MTEVRMKDWCIAALDPERVGRFWGAALGLDRWVHTRPGVVGVGPQGTAQLWINRTDQAKVVKDRVHPDLLVPDLDRLLALGATVHSEQDVFTVLADPEGHEMCAFPGGDPEGPPATVFAWCTDSARPVEVAAWWAARTGATVGPGPDGTPRYLHGVPGLGDVTWKFVPVDDERVGENRVHWDLEGDADELEAAGATVARRPDGDIDWTVMRDPDGNVFCCFAP